jgi:hypothetical protein
VRAFARRHATSYAVTASTRASICDWAVTEVPTLFLVLPNGRVAWRGRATALDAPAVARVVERTPSLARLPADLGWVETALRSERLGEAEARLRPLAEDASSPLAPAASRAAAFLAWYGDTLERQASRDVERGRVVDAVKTWEHLARAWAGTGRAGTARERVAALLVVPAHVHEVEADRALCAVDQETRSTSAVASAQRYAAFAARWTGTEAGARAACHARDLSR